MMAPAGSDVSDDGVGAGVDVGTPAVCGTGVGVGMGVGVDVGTGVAVGMGVGVAVGVLVGVGVGVGTGSSPHARTRAVNMRAQARTVILMGRRIGMIVAIEAQAGSGRKEDEYFARGIKSPVGEEPVGSKNWPSTGSGRTGQATRLRLLKRSIAVEMAWGTALLYIGPVSGVSTRFHHSK